MYIYIFIYIYIYTYIHIYTYIYIYIYIYIYRLPDNASAGLRAGVVVQGYLAHKNPEP